MKNQGSFLQSPSQIIIVTLLIVSSYLIGSLKTKVEFLEKSSQPVAAAPNPGTAQAPQPPAQPQTADNVPKVQKDDHIRGKSNARIALIEYSDLECPYCKQFHPTVKQVLDEYKNDVVWVYRHYPLGFHANAQKEAEASECANDLGGSDAFWRYIDTIYERTSSNGSGFSLDALVPLAEEIGLNSQKFKTCLDGGTFTQKIKDQMDAGTAAGISGTPGNVLLDTKTGKTRLIPGAVPFEQIKSAIDEMLKA
ncbi:MAG: DsbA family protein [bacterium]|nr:DsbA family protein [bacterium]